MRPSTTIPACMLLALALAGSACLAAGPDHNRYKWRDGAGNLHYGDTLPAEAAQYGYEIINPQGIVIRRVERRKTAEELAAAKAAAAREAAERRAQEERDRADAQLLAGYPEETDLVRAQQQKMELMEQRVTSASISLRSQEQILGDALARAAAAERNDKALSEMQQQQLADIRKQVEDLRQAVARREGEREAARADFERELARYRELKKARAKPDS